MSDELVIQVAPRRSTSALVQKDAIQHMSAKHIGKGIKKDVLEKFIDTPPPPAPKTEARTEMREKPKARLRAMPMPDSQSDTETDSEDEIILVKRKGGDKKTVEPQRVYSDLHALPTIPEPEKPSRYGKKADFHIPIRNPMLLQPQDPSAFRYGKQAAPTPTTEPVQSRYGKK